MSIMNPGEKHVACCLLVDISGSMQGSSIEELNRGLAEFGKALQDDAMAYGCTDVCVISFDSQVRTVFPFSSASEYTAPVLSAGGMTAMNAAIITALDAIENRKQDYRTIGVDYWRPWLFLMTDGVPTDLNYEADAKRRLQYALAHKKVTFFPMGIGSANTTKLKEYTLNGNGMILKASADHFKEAFVWLSRSMSVISNSNPYDTNAELPPIPKTISIEL